MAMRSSKWNWSNQELEQGDPLRSRRNSNGCRQDPSSGEGGSQHLEKGGAESARRSSRGARISQELEHEDQKRVIGNSKSSQDLEQEKPVRVPRRSTGSRDRQESKQGDLERAMRSSKGKQELEQRGPDRPMIRGSRELELGDPVRGTVRSLKGVRGSQGLEHGEPETAMRGTMGASGSQESEQGELEMAMGSSMGVRGRQEKTNGDLERNRRSQKLRGVRSSQWYSTDDGSGSQGSPINRCFQEVAIGYPQRIMENQEPLFGDQEMDPVDIVSVLAEQMLTLDDLGDNWREKRGALVDLERVSSDQESSLGNAVTVGGQGGVLGDLDGAISDPEIILDDQESVISDHDPLSWQESILGDQGSVLDEQESAVADLWTVLDEQDIGDQEVSSSIEELTVMKKPGVTVLSLISSDVVLVDADTESQDQASRPTRERTAHDVRVNNWSIEETCIGCGSLQTEAQHPVFYGGLCAPCKEMFLETYFLYDDSGSPSYCLICSSGNTVLICDAPSCSRCFCLECLDILVGPGTAELAQSQDRWLCYLCLPYDCHGLLRKRKKWRCEVKAFYDQEYEHVTIFKPVTPWKRRPLQVLALFSDISRELTELGFLGPTSGGGRITYVHDVASIKRRDVQHFGPVDFVFGATPRLGAIFSYSSAWYFYQYYRLLDYARPPEGSPKPFFWMFVDNLALEEEVSDAATFRFFQTNPLTVYEEQDGDIVSAVQVWGNIPSLKSKYASPAWNMDLMELREELSRKNHVGTRVAKLIKRFLVPLKEYFRCLPSEVPRHPCLPWNSGDVE